MASTSSLTVVYFLLVFTIYNVSSAPELQLLSGIVRGQDERAVTSSAPYYAYYGIPFARPPVADLRFQPPKAFVTKDPDQVISSDNYRDACIQFPSRASIISQSEDCLYLNVFTPVGTSGRFNPESRRKVMVWIHGGSYTSGDASYFRPSRLVSEYDVIVVIIQYRLGPFGFLSSGDEVLPGNSGLRDQVMALQWVKDNILVFGGDPDDVTLFGQSAGASSVSILALSPLTKGLFTKVILQSGSALAPWTLNRKPQDTFFKVAQKTKCLPWFYFPSLRSGYNRHILRCLKQLTPYELTNAIVMEIFQAVVNFDLQKYSVFSPVVDNELLPKEPLALVTNTGYLREIGALDRKYMVGVTNNEGIYVVESLLAVGYTVESLLREPTTHQALQDTVKGVLPLPVTSDVINFATLTYLYPRTWNGQVELQGLIDLFSDTNFVIPAIQLTRALVKASSQVDIYFFLFDHYPELKQNASTFQGSQHGMDVSFLFDETFAIEDSVSSYAKIWTESSKPLLDIFRSSVTNLAKTGIPSIKGVAPWPRYDLRNESYMAIRTSPEVRHGLYPRRVSFWTDFLPNVTGAIFATGPGRAPFRV